MRKAEAKKIAEDIASKLVDRNGKREPLVTNAIACRKEASAWIFLFGYDCLLA